MAEATIEVKTLPTNPQWQYCGPPDPQVKDLLENLSIKSKKSRIEWLQQVCETPLPNGPYPFMVEERGWFKGHICDERFQACYVVRKDLNLDVKIFEKIRDTSGRIVKRVLVQDAEQRIQIRVCKVDLWATYAALYPKENLKIKGVWEIAEVTVKTMEALILREVECWEDYDLEVMENRKLMMQVKQGPNQCEVICRGVADEKVALQAMLKDAKAKEAKEAKSMSKPRRAKRCLPFTDKVGPEEAPNKMPKVRFVSKLEKAEAGLNAVNKQVGSTLWVIKKLEDEKAFSKILARKTKKIAASMFELLPREDLVNIAVKLAQNCALDSLEEVLQVYRRQALIVAQKKYNEHVRQSIVANNKLAQVQKEVDNDELGENAVDAMPFLEDYGIGPPEDGPSEDGPPEDASPEDASPEDGPPPPEDGPPPPEDGPSKDGPSEDGPPEDGPPEDGPATPAGVAREHWIKSSRSSSGYKGVILEKKSGRYRIKHGGNTIARRNTLEEACSFYYNWCVAHGLIKDFRLV